MLREIVSRLQAASESPGLDAQVLLAHVLGKSRPWVLAHPEVQLDAPQASTLAVALERLERGEPLPYVLGRWEFYGLELQVSPAVLIPRPETECLVEQALAWLRAHPGRRRVLDVCTGSGCIAVALAVNLPGLQLLASDISFAALQVAGANARQHGVSPRWLCVQADLLPPSAAPWDLICANPPYVPHEALPELRVAAWEPRLALDGGPDGLVFIRRLLSLAPQALSPKGLFLMEIEASQGAAVLALARAAFPGADVQVLPDLAGRQRLLRVERSGG
ncbi:MAG: peptide chain release factor N(5)-glutamine methyltransferase [Chloroflexota bacterium]